MPGGFGTFYIATAVINAFSSLYNGKLARDQQREIAQQNQEFSKKMEENRQNFQLSVNQSNASLQRELNAKNHQFRLEEQQKNFEIMCRSTEWQRFIAEWPLKVLPSVLREEQILNDQTVALRVFFAKSSDKYFTSLIYPEVEQGLVEFIDRYHNIFQSRNILFYHNAYKENCYGGAVNTNIRYALKALPVVIIDTNVLAEEICISLTVWGFGNALEQHATVFKLPYKWESEGGKIKKSCVKGLTNQILAALKYIIGYAYDTYNLLTYNKAPLLWDVARYEFEQGIESSPLNYEEIQKNLALQYEEIYTAVLGNRWNGPGIENNAAERNFNETVLYELRLEYANATKPFLPQEEYLRYLDESIRAWAALRSDKEPEAFLQLLANTPEEFSKYFNAEDVQYFIKLCRCYEGIQGKSLLKSLCLALKEPVEAFVPGKTNSPVSKKRLTGQVLELPAASKKEDKKTWIEF
ncbi:MAG: hypothetical protein KHX56_15710 [Clostridiales bacterium]|nr:hypothetical protein [Clostridiales bacterium]